MFLSLHPPQPPGLYEKETEPFKGICQMSGKHA